MLTEEQKKLVEENYKLVPYVIFSVMHLDDLEEWHGYACIGLCNAAVLWDKKKGPFATYAVKAIKNSIIREINYKYYFYKRYIILVKLIRIITIYNWKI